MKSEKTTAPSRKQIAIMAKLGIEPSETETQHSATKKINKALVLKEKKNAN